MNERIKKIRRYFDLTQQEFADRLGTTRNNIAGYETGRRSPSVAVVSSICDKFNVNEHWLRTGEGGMFVPAAKDTLGAFIRERNLTSTDRILIEKFVSLSVKARWEVVRFVLDISDALWEESKNKISVSEGAVSTQEQVRMVEMLVYINPAAAGSSLYAEDDVENISFPENEIPLGADFGVRISGKSMEPTVEDKSIVWVSRTVELEDDDIGIFMLNDSAVCKRYHKSPEGMIRLESDNPEYGPVPIREFDNFEVVGKVLLK